MPEYRITVDGRTYAVDIGRISDDSVEVRLDGRRYLVEVEAPMRKPSKTPTLTRRREVVNAGESPDRTSRPGIHPERGSIVAPLPGLVLRILVGKGDTVSEGQPVALMEAMKMENEIESPVSGRVEEIMVSEGENVLENAVIMRIGD